MMKLLLPLSLCLLAATAPARHAPSAAAAVFVATTPCGASIRPLLGIAADATAEMVRWDLTLRSDPATGAPASYELHARYGVPIQGTARMRETAPPRVLRGAWKRTQGTKDDRDAVVYQLDGFGSLLALTEDVIHVLERDGSPMVGTSGWSYTLSRREAAEAPVDPSLDNAPDRSYTLQPLATGPSAFGVFEGRTPCQGIARGLKVRVEAACSKVKWRVTLYQDPLTRAPTRYRVESSLHRERAREGSWTVVHGTPSDADAVVYQLAATESEAPLLLLRGDPNVLFFLGQDGRPLTGHAAHSYTLNRRGATAGDVADGRARRLGSAPIREVVRVPVDDEGRGVEEGRMRLLRAGLVAPALSHAWRRVEWGWKLLSPPCRRLRSRRRR